MLYHLSVNPEKQDILRKECLSVESITIKDLDKLKYLKACLLEALRLTPLLPIHSRVISEDMIVAGYHIPKDTLVLWSNNMLGMVFQPFSALLWIMVLLLYILTSFVFWMVSRINPEERGLTIFDAFWNIASAFVYASRPAPNACSKRLVGTIYIYVKFLCL